ncbi:MAG: hypothetical protein JSR80_03420 [Verrucomicrobia bacterium]|nr:hypothetical protein [Verrucomicrobiota bacterium]
MAFVSCFDKKTLILRIADQESFETPLVEEQHTVKINFNYIKSSSLALGSIFLISTTGGIARFDCNLKKIAWEIQTGDSICKMEEVTYGNKGYLIVASKTDVLSFVDVATGEIAIDLLNAEKFSSWKFFQHRGLLQQTSIKEISRGIFKKRKHEDAK